MLPASLQVERIEVKNGRFMAYFNGKYMQYDEEKHAKILKSTSLIKLRALQGFKPAKSRLPENRGDEGDSAENIVTTEASEISSYRSKNQQPQN